MSGHSHWAGIKHKKGLEDAKRGKIFSKLSRMISIAAREGGNPEFNTKLKQTIEEAKAANMPKENIERAIKKGTGELEGERLEEVVYEVVGPNGIALIIEGITDNKNRALSEIKQILTKHNVKLTSEGAVKWQFEKRGIITINPKFKVQTSNQIQNLNNRETVELTTIEAGAEDIQWYQEEDEDFLEVRTKPDELDRVRKNLEEKELRIESSALGWIAKEELELSEKEKAACQRLFEELDENETVQTIYSNLKN